MEDEKEERISNTNFTSMELSEDVWKKMEDGRWKIRAERVCVGEEKYNVRHIMYIMYI